MRKHQANLDGYGMDFVEAKPYKNFNEKIAKTKTALANTMEPKINRIEEKSADFSEKVDQKLYEWGCKVGSSASRFGAALSHRFK